MYIRVFDSETSRSGENINFIKEKFGYPAPDIEAWLRTVGYPQDCLVIKKDIITGTLRVLEEAGVLKAPEGGFSFEQFVETKVAKLV